MNRPEINVTPLIDVLLVLLIIFMVVTPVKPSRFQARVPAEPTNDIADPNPHTLIVTVGSDRSLKVNSEPPGGTIESPEKTAERLAGIFRERSGNMVSERTVFIKAPENLDYGSVIKVIDAVKGSGADPISLQIDGLQR